jgi:hypothetical protein
MRVEKGIGFIDKMLIRDPKEVLSHVEDGGESYRTKPSRLVGYRSQFASKQVVLIVTAVTAS